MDDVVEEGIDRLQELLANADTNNNTTIDFDSIVDGIEYDLSMDWEEIKKFEKLAEEYEL